MFTRIEDVANRAVIPRSCKMNHTGSKIGAKESGAGLSATIPEGMRGRVRCLNEVVGVAGFVTPGDGDVAGDWQDDRKSRWATLRERFLKIFAYWRRTKVEQDREGKPQTVAVITLLVTPDESLRS